MYMFLKLLNDISPLCFEGGFSKKKKNMVILNWTWLLVIIRTFVSLTVTYDALVCVWIRFIFTLKPHIF